MSADVVDFPAFLSSHGFLSQVDAERVRLVVRNDSVPLGKVLVTAGMMNVKALMAVLAHQAEHPESRFGSIAIELGFITPEQLGEALRRQSQVRVHPARVVLDLDLLDDETWRDAMIEYCKFQETRVT